MSSARWLSVGVAVAALAVAGCGGGGASSDGGSGQTETAAKAPAKCNGDSVRFQLSFFPNAQHVGFLVAANRGYFAQQGLKVKMIPGGPTVNPPLQLAQGNVDIAQMDFPQMLNAVANGAQMKWVAQTYQQDPLRYISLKDVNLSSPADLKGKLVGTQQVGDPEAELRGLLANANVTINDIKLKAIGFSIEDLMNHRIQVFPLQTFFHVAQLEDAGVSYPSKVNILDPNKYDAAIAAQGLAVNSQWYEQHRDATVCFLRAALKGWQTAIDDPRGAVKDVERYIAKGVASHKDNITDVAETVKLVTTNVAGQKVDPLSIDMAYMNQTQDRSLKYGVIKQKQDLTSIVDQGPLQQARQGAGGA